MSEQLAMSSRRGLRPLSWLAGLLVVWVWLLLAIKVPNPLRTVVGIVSRLIPPLMRHGFDRLLEQVLVHHDRRAIESTGIAFRSEDVCVKHTVNIALLGCGGEAESLE